MVRTVLSSEHRDNIDGNGYITGKAVMVGTDRYKMGSVMMGVGLCLMGVLEVTYLSSI